MTRQTYRSLGFWLRRPNAVFQELPHGLLFDLCCRPLP
jgi:hypothetical protein